MNARFCNQQKSTEVTSRPHSHQRPWGQRELEITGKQGVPIGCFLNNPYCGPCSCFQLSSPLWAQTEHEVKEPLAPLLPVFPKPKSSNQIPSSQCYYNNAITVLIISYPLKQWFSALSGPELLFYIKCLVMLPLLF